MDSSAYVPDEIKRNETKADHSEAVPSNLVTQSPLAMSGTVKETEEPTQKKNSAFFTETVTEAALLSTAS